MPQDNTLRSFGDVYNISGTARGTTTSSGVLVVNTGFARRVVWAEATDALTRFRRADLTLGTQATFYMLRQISVNPTYPTQARFRVSQFQMSLAGSLSSFSTATSNTGVVVNWLAKGY